jgi:hypothetical protein
VCMPLQLMKATLDCLLCIRISGVQADGSRGDNTSLCDDAAGKCALTTVHYCLRAFCS